MTEDEASAERLQQFRLKQAAAEKRCKELNQDASQLNRMGGIGYHAKYGRVICNPPKPKPPIT